MKKKTTVAALFSAIALVTKAIADAAADGLQWDDAAMIFGALMLAMQCYFSRDRDVTSEGTRTTAA